MFLSEFNEACLELYKPNLHLETYAARSFRFLSKLLPAEFIAFGSLQLDSQNLSIELSESISNFAELMPIFSELMGQYALFRWDPTVNAGKPFTTSDFFSPRQFKQLDIYEDVFKALGVTNHCAVLIPGNHNEINFLGIERKGYVDYSSRERELLSLAQSQLANARLLAHEHSKKLHHKIDPKILNRAGFTPREADVLVWLTEGKSNEEIAILLSISLHTVKGYLKVIFKKIGVENRLSAALWAIQTCRTQAFNIQPHNRVNFAYPPPSRG
ncbi:helix-turn-helix transcriptional regulator [Coraliomargarita algicola]|uniref:Helix-turn-helix transcriptional regulator n=1 Tax=Coraliomargarita algicola TaxID=3092156 RepID=A0ABZ0RFF8_9BACT|nr:helix-turn-helix transcriptional regulator [Coraliomargarita sp. J2-16]WPJ94796.1 helix-turn-helix transcriptional regulator [Coraliomargarita sp. J2-16]